MKIVHLFYHVFSTSCQMKLPVTVLQYRALPQGSQNTLVVAAPSIPVETGNLRMMNKDCDQIWPVMDIRGASGCPVQAAPFLWSWCQTQSYHNTIYINLTSPKLCYWKETLLVRKKNLESCVCLKFLQEFNAMEFFPAPKTPCILMW